MRSQFPEPEKCPLFCAVALAISLMPLAAMAAENDAEATASDALGRPVQLEEVTVKAEKTERADLQKAPLAVTTVSAERLMQGNINNITDLNGLVPGLVVSKSGGAENMIAIRGVGSETPENTNTQPGVSYHLDGVYIFNTIATNAAFIDADQVEVLRGPQGTLFGQSSTGGTINVASKTPELGVFGGDASLGLGNHGLVKSSASLNLPAGDTFALRAHVQQYRHDGYSKVHGIDGVASYEVDQADDLGWKVSALWQPSDDFSWTLSATGYRSDTNAPGQKNILDPATDPRSLSQDFAGKARVDTDLFTSVMRWNLGGTIFKSISSYQRLKSDQSWDADGLTADLFWQETYSPATGSGDTYDHVGLWQTEADAYTQEFNLSSYGNGPVQWITGLVYMHSTNDQYVVEFKGDDDSLVNPIPPKDTPAADAPYNLTFGNVSSVTRKSMAAYFQGSVDLSERAKLTAGLRYNTDTYSGISGSYYATPRPTDGLTTNEFTGKLALDYQFSPSSMGYVSFTRGYKPGGLNSSASAVWVKDVFQPETVNSFELGSKNRFLDNRLQFNASAYYYDYKNMQFLEEDPVLYAKGTSNAPSAHLYGAEFELVWLVDRDWMLEGNLALERGKFDQDYAALDPVDATAAQDAAGFPGGLFWANYAAAVAARDGARANINGNDVPKIPKVQGNIALTNTHDFSAGTLVSKLEAVYRGSYQYRLFNNSFYDTVPSYSLWNLYLEYLPVESAWSYSLAVTNLTDKLVVNSRFSDPYGSFQTYQTYMPPRQFILSASYRF